MANSEDKKPCPPYVSYASFKGFINGLGESIVPNRIDKTVMSNYNGSTVYALLPALQFFKLIDKDGTPSPLLKKLAKANDEDMPELLNPMVKDCYHFLFQNGFDISSSSAGQVIDVFNDQGVNGATVTKCMSFFLSIAKDSGIEVSPLVKPPVVRRKPKKSKTKHDGKSGNNNDPDDLKNEDEDTPPPPPKNMERITVPLRGMDDAIIYFPSELSEDSLKDEARRAVKMAKFILEEYYNLDD